MSIISFLNTVYDTTQHSQRYGLPDSLIQGDEKYNYNTLRYPLDIGSADKGHYIVIHINTQARTQYQTSNLSSDNPSYIDQALKVQALRGPDNPFSALKTGGTMINDTFSSLSNSQAGKAFNQALNSQYAQDITSVVSSVAQSGTNMVGNATGYFGMGNPISGTKDFVTSGFDTISSASKNINGTERLRTIRRTTDSITLYMPDTLNFEYRQNYDELKLGPGLGGFASALASTYDAMKTGGAGKAGQVAAPFIASYVAGNFGDFGRSIAAAGLGMVQNPMLELIYSQPAFRTFQFDFMLYPRDEKEALEVQKILERLRFHQAPEIKSSSYGFFLIPPSEFDIKFYYNGRINENIDPISTCVLENIIVNYSPSSSFTAYESVGENYPKLGSTGMPVAIQLTLMFKETQILTKENHQKLNMKINQKVVEVYPIPDDKDLTVYENDWERTKNVIRRDINNEIFKK